MLTILFAIIYGRWFYKTAEARAGFNPKLWAAIGFALFAGVSSAVSWGTSKMYVIMLIRDANLSETLGYITAGAMVLAGWVVANGFAQMVYKTCLQANRTDLDRRRSIAMPGPFPVHFMMFFAAGSFLAIPLLMIAMLVLREYPAGTMEQSKFVMDSISTIVKAIGFSLVMWKCRHWVSIATGWAAISCVVFGCTVVYVVYTKAGIIPPLLPVAMTFATVFVTMSITALAVQRWGASLKVLLAACLLPRLCIDLPLALLTSKTPLPEFYVFPVLWGVMSALALYGGLLAHTPREETEETPSGGTVAFSS